MPMKNPPHLGSSIKDACLESVGLNVTEAAKVLGIARHTLSRLLNGHSGISPDMAIRLEKVFGSTADTWLGMQMQYELWEARQRSDKIQVNRSFATAVPW